MSPRARLTSWLVIAIAACGDAPAAAPDAQPDAFAYPGPLPDGEALARPVPDTDYNHGVLACVLGQVDALDECVACECGVFGLRCSRRAGCAREVCVLADGTVLARGATATIAGCFDCTCDAAGPRCTRQVGGDCPADGCAVVIEAQPQVVPYGQRLTSETSWCTCDETRGWTDCTGFTDYCQAPGGAPADYGERYPRPDCGSCACATGWPNDPCDLRNCE